ncbi:MAG TPA: chemotaxis protein CheA [Cellvibrionaceae bacterium]
MDTDRFLQTFFSEADELLTSMEASLLHMDEGYQNSEIINELFRAVHTIKGSAGMFGLVEIVGFTHVVENVLDMARDGKLIIANELLSILLSCRDHIASLVNNAKKNITGDADCLAKSERLISSLGPWVLEGNNSSDINSTSSLQNTAVAEVSGQNHSLKSVSQSDLAQDLWLISVHFGADLLRNGMDPLSILRFLNTFGEITRINTYTDSFPSAEDFDPETLYLKFDIYFCSNTSLEEIEQAFVFVREESLIKIIPPRSDTAALSDLIKSLPKSNQRLGEILVSTHAISVEDLEFAIDTQKQQAKEQAPVALLGDILVNADATAPEVINAALSRQQSAVPESRTSLPEQRYIRVEAERLDKLINLIGELVTNRQRVDLLASQIGNSQLNEAVTSIGNFTEQIRDAALTLRMVAIGDTFLRFKRVVRDTAKELGKEIELEIQGAETELDRAMVEKLNDPLMHIVRNAIDHGIESIGVRRARNKSDAGTITLKASHGAGNIVIEISDDGGGLDLERIRKKAINNGLLDEDSQISQQDLCQLIFHPGLSTAEKITNLSGRGVGMDVVKRNIESLRGTIEIETELGVGTSMRIFLPLTLAIIDGFHVAAGNIDFIIPRNTILECIDLNTFSRSQEQNCVDLRGEQVPFIRLQELFQLEKQQNTREKLVVVQFGEKRAGIVVDYLYGETQTVVKPMGPIFHALKGIGGSSLLGAGTVALILDVPQLIQFAILKEYERNTSSIAGMQE